MSLSVCAFTVMSYTIFLHEECRTEIKEIWLLFLTDHSSLANGFQNLFPWNLFCSHYSPN